MGWGLLYTRTPVLFLSAPWDLRRAWTVCLAAKRLTSRAEFCPVTEHPLEPFVGLCDPIQTCVCQSLSAEAFCHMKP